MNTSTFLDIPRMKEYCIVFLCEDEHHRACVLRSPCDEPVTNGKRGKASVGASECDGPLNADNPQSPPLVLSKQTNGLRRFKQAASCVPTSFSVPSAFPARGSASPCAQPLCLPYLPTLPPPSTAPTPAYGPLCLFFRVTASLSFSSVSCERLVPTRRHD